MWTDEDEDDYDDDDYDDDDDDDDVFMYMSRAENTSPYAASGFVREEAVSRPGPPGEPADHRDDHRALDRLVACCESVLVELRCISARLDAMEAGADRRREERARARDAAAADDAADDAAEAAGSELGAVGKLVKLLSLSCIALALSCLALPMMPGRVKA